MNKDTGKESSQNVGKKVNKEKEKDKEIFLKDGELVKKGSIFGSGYSSACARKGN